MVCMASMLDWLGGPYIYIYILYIYIYIYIYIKWTSMQGLYAQLTGGSICLVYICFVLDLAVDVAVCKASMLNWQGGLDLPVGVAVCKACMLNWLGAPSASYIYALY